jgi:hypothetical protein
MAKAGVSAAVSPPNLNSQSDHLWTTYAVRWEFLTSVCGSVPADPDIVRKWLEARAPRVKAAGAMSIDEINEEVLASLARGEGEADQDVSLLMFQKHGGVLVMRHGTVRAHIKDCARILSTQFVGKFEGEKAFSTRVLNGVYTDPAEYWIPIRRADGSPVTEPDGVKDKAVHAYVRGRGQISALKRFEYVDQPVMDFRLLVLGKSVSETDLHHVFSYGGVHGYAGERGDGEGRYSYSLRRVDAPA